MFSRLTRHRSPAVQGLLALLVGLLVLIAVVLYAHAHYRSLPQAVQRPAPPSVDRIAGWMTVRYVARTYHVPEPVLLQALRISLTQARFRSLASVARLRHSTTNDVLLIVRSATRDYRARTTATPTPRRTGD